MIVLKKESIGYLVSVEKGGAGSGNYGHAGRPGEIGGSSDNTTHASKEEITRQLSKVRKTELSTHGKICEARATLNEVLNNPNATDKQRETANRLSSLLEKYEAELPENKNRKL